MKNKEFVLNGNNFSNLEGFYDEVERVLTKDMTWNIGRNFMALDEVLEGGFGAFEEDESILLTWKNVNKSKDDLGWDETIKYCEYQLKVSHPTNIEYAKNDLALAKEHKGETLFQIIIKMIKEHKNIKLILS